MPKVAKEAEAKSYHVFLRFVRNIWHHMRLAEASLAGCTHTATDIHHKRVEAST